MAGHAQLAHWLAAVAGHAPIQIAVGCRLHGEARSLLRSGALGDPTACTVADVMYAATGTALWGAEIEMRPVCRATTRLARDAMKCWSPTRHWLFHRRFRAAVHTVLRVRYRLVLLAEAAGDADEQAFPEAPLEMWLLVCAMLLRRHWACA